MLNRGLFPPQSPAREQYQRGAGLIEVLVSVLLTSFGLLALAGLQAKMSQAQFEAYQRTQAIVLLENMVGRLQANGAHAADYLTASPLGTGHSNSDCNASLAATDRCEWSDSLKGAGEKKSTGDGASNLVGAMLSARGCIEQIQTTELAICRPAIYRVTVAWQGLSATTAPNVSCGKDLYGSDAERRAITSQVVIPLTSCS